LGDRRLAELTNAYLTYQLERLRPGSYKAIRFAAELLVSHLGINKTGDITQAQGREVLSLISPAVPLTCGSIARDSLLASLNWLPSRQSWNLGKPWHPKPQARIWKHMQQLFDWCVEQGRTQCQPVGTYDHQRKARGLPSQGPDGCSGGDTAPSQRQGAFERPSFWPTDRACAQGSYVGCLPLMSSAKGNLGRFIQIQPNEIRQ
jgi:hypothetical protein